MPKVRRPSSVAGPIHVTDPGTDSFDDMCRIVGLTHHCWLILTEIVPHPGPAHGKMCLVPARRGVPAEAGVPHERGGRHGPPGSVVPGRRSTSPRTEP